MNFKYLVKIAEEEVLVPDNWHLSIIIENLINRANNEIQNGSPKLDEVIADTKKDIAEYTNKKGETTIKTKTIEYYIGKNSYSHSKYNINRAFKELGKQKDKIDYDEIEKHDIQYTYNLDENMKLLTSGILSKIKKDKEAVAKIFNNKQFYGFFLLTKKDREKFLRNMSHGDEKVYEALKKLTAFYDKSEKELIEQEVKSYTKKASDALKKECIVSIRENIELLDKYGLMEKFVEANNIMNKNIYLFNCDYTYEEVMDSLSEKSLKELSAEQLIGMTAYWDNRTAKEISEINKAVYILSHPELYQSKKLPDGKLSINVSEDTMKNVHLKMNLLQKVCFEIFDEAEDLLDDEEKEQSRVSDISYEIDEICNNYEKEYKNYLDKKLIYSKNDIKDDVIEALKAENLIYNLYTTKGENIQALLISALSSGTDCIQNYGVIDEKYKQNSSYILLGIDIPGMNMPLRLHTRESNVLEVLKSAQNGNETLPQYLGAKDFHYRGEKNIIPTQIYVPASKEKVKQYKEAVEKINERDKYANTIRHIAYIAGKGKMPEHMSKEKNNEKEL